MKKRRPRLQLTEEQQLILALLLVILLAVSVLYCLGFASLALRQIWEDLPLPWNETPPPPQEIETTPTPLPDHSLLAPQSGQSWRLTGAGFTVIIDWLDVEHRQEKGKVLWTSSPC